VKKPKYRWIPENRKRIIIPILDSLDQPTRDQVEADLEKIAEDPDDHPFPAVAYRGHDVPGGRVALICNGRFAVLYIKYADHPVLACRNFLDAARAEGEGEIEIL
jgi:hypothetical protein